MTILSPAARQKLEEPFALLAESLKAAAKNRRVIFMQNDGNFGDALIRYGTLQFFEDLNLPFKEFDMSFPKDKLACLGMGLWDKITNKYLFVYSGNGAWCTTANAAYRNVRRQKKLTNNLFILPTTFEKYRMDFNFPVFIRDKFQSSEFLPGKPFCHDMGFYLALIAPERLLPDRLAPTQKVGLMLRTDNESAGHNLGTWPENHDISASDNHRNDPKEFLRYLDQFEHIVTDRLHIAIGGALLNKKVTLLAGSYFKIKAIFESSIAGIFENIAFIEKPTEDF